MKNSKLIEESLIGINKAEYFGYPTPVQRHAVIRGKPIAIYMHNSSNGTSQLCSFRGNSSQNSPRKVKSAPPPSFPPSSPFRYKRFFSPSGEKRRTSRSLSRQSVRCCQPLHFRATFAALFRLTKLQRDFHKAQRRAENKPVIREWQGERKGWSRSSEMEGKLCYPRHENSRHELSLSSLGLGRDSLQESQRSSELWSIL